MPDRDFIDQLAGYSLTTAEILYRLPDHPSLLQCYVWQDYDVHPRFPKLARFLEFWSDNLEGGLYRVRIAHSRLLSPRDVAFARGSFNLN